MGFCYPYICYSPSTTDSFTVGARAGAGQESRSFHALVGVLLGFWDNCRAFDAPCKRYSPKRAVRNDPHSRLQLNFSRSVTRFVTSVTRFARALLLVALLVGGIVTLFCLTAFRIEGHRRPTPVLTTVSRRRVGVDQPEQGPGLLVKRWRCADRHRPGRRAEHGFDTDLDQFKTRGKTLNWLSTRVESPGPKHAVRSQSESRATSAKKRNPIGPFACAAPLIRRRHPRAELVGRFPKGTVSAQLIEHRSVAHGEGDTSRRCVG